MHKLFFYNNWHNGDIIFERPLVRRILDRYPNVQITWGCWRNHKVLIQDLPVTVIAHANDDREPGPGLPDLCPADHKIIYLWVGQYPDTRHTRWSNVVEVYNRQVKSHGLDLMIACGDVPMVDFPFIEIATLNNAVYVENGPVRAMQSKFDFDMRQLSAAFPDLNFYCTSDPKWSAPNVFNCGKLNLVQLSALSNRCDALIGKGSGTFACAMTEVNRYKPQALMNFHSYDGATFWEYPGCTTEYLETYEQLVQFLQQVRGRPKINLTVATATPKETPQVGVVHLPAGAPSPFGAAGGFAGLVAHQISRCALQYAVDPNNEATLRQLLQGRLKLANIVLSLSDFELEIAFRGAVGKAHQDLLAGSLRMSRYEGMGEEAARAAERDFAEGLSRSLEKSWTEPGAAQHFLAAILYFYPHQLPVRFDVEQLPAWFVEYYLTIMLTPPPLFRKKGEADQYLEFTRQLFSYLAAGVRANPESIKWKHAALVFTQRANVIPLYFNQQNVKDVFQRRAEIIEHTLQSLGHELNHPFPVRSAGEPKIRLGILAPSFHPSAETSASLPLYEHLSSEFEVTLYCLSPSGAPSEEYCKSRAKALKVLPQDLKAQVDFLRSDDLDILFFASNVAAVTNQMALLATHRVARKQATSIFSIVTTGFRNMDYYVSGTATDPSASAQGHYAERLIQMEGSVHCFVQPPQAPSTTRIDRTMAAIDPAAIVFASGANFHKIIPELMHTWAKILAGAENSILLLFPYGPNWSNTYPKAVFIQFIAEVLAEYGLDLRRIRILDQTPAPNREDIKTFLTLADVYLDSFPFCGSTSLIEPLEVGLPPVVRRGEQLRGSMAAAMMQELGMPEMIASDDEAYIQLALTLGRDSALRTKLASQVRERMNAKPRFVDSVSYAARIEPIYKTMLTPQQ
jgi:predicted O-linked N-acetylglucosamine transferase (SPINDLY family)